AQQREDGVTDAGRIQLSATNYPRRLENRRGHTIHVAQHVLIADPQHAPALRFDHLCPAEVAQDLIVVSVHATIHLYRELELQTGEVRDGPVDRVVPTKAQAVERAAAKGLPESRFGGGRLPSKAAGELGALSKHDRILFGSEGWSPHPPVAPQRGPSFPLQG